MDIKYIPIFTNDKILEVCSIDRINLLSLWLQQTCWKIDKENNYLHINMSVHVLIHTFKKKKNMNMVIQQYLQLCWLFQMWPYGNKGVLANLFDWTRITLTTIGMLLQFGYSKTMWLLKNNRTFLYFYKLIWLSDNCMGMQVIQILTQFLIMQNILGIFIW